MVSQKRSDSYQGGADKQVPGHHIRITEEVVELLDVDHVVTDVLLEESLVSWCPGVPPGHCRAPPQH